MLSSVTTKFYEQMKNITKTLALLFIVFVLHSCDSDDDNGIDPVASLINNLQGEWVSEELTVFPINIPNSDISEAYLQEVFEFKGQTNTISSTAYLDRDLTVPVLIYRSVGPFTVIGENPLFPNTWEADFANTNQTLELTTSDPEIISVFGFDDCGITEQGVVYNINDGCSIFPGIDDCIELDIIQVQNNTLRFGTRTTDICEVRVTTLQETFYTKID